MKETARSRLGCFLKPLHSQCEMWCPPLSLSPHIEIKSLLGVCHNICIDLQQL